MKRFVISLLDTDIDVSWVVNQVLVDMTMDIELTTAHLVRTEGDMAGDEVIFLEFTTSPEFNTLEGTIRRAFETVVSVVINPQVRGVVRGCTRTF